VNESTQLVTLDNNCMYALVNHELNTLVPVGTFIVFIMFSYIIKI